MKIRLAGDICLPEAGRLNADGVGRLSGNYDLLIANLETPILPKNEKKALKAGPHLSGSVDTLNAMAESFCSLCFNLANNHMMDYGNKGLEETIRICSERGVHFVGAGKNLQEAAQPLVLEIGGKRLGIIGTCETQFGIATPWRPGVAPLSPVLAATIRKLKKKVDRIIVSVHGALEMVPWPSPKRQDLLRSLIDAGADVIHGHHSHVPQGYERYKKGLIFYGLGNFLVPPEKWRHISDAQWSVIADCEFFPEGVSFSIQTVCLRLQKDGISPLMSNSNNYKRHEAYLTRCNRPLADRRLLEGLWQETAIWHYHQFYSPWLGFLKAQDEQTGCRERKSTLSRLLSFCRQAVSRHSAPAGSQMTGERLLLWYHLFACESHRDAIATALGVLGGELEDMRTEETSALSKEIVEMINRNSAR